MKQRFVRVVLPSVLLNALALRLTLILMLLLLPAANSFTTPLSPQSLVRFGVRHSRQPLPGCRRISSSSENEEPLPAATPSVPTTKESDDNDNSGSSGDGLVWDNPCDSEEECEIDWDAMPGGSAATSEAMQTAVAAMANDNQDDDIDDDDESDEFNETATADPSSGNNKSTKNRDTRRVRLEMQWQMQQAAEDCNVDLPQSCGSDPCHDCHGKGWTTCRFCRGTSVLYLPATVTGVVSTRVNSPLEEPPQRHLLPQQAFVSCKICQQGMERCRSCQGTGWIANWTQMQGTAH